MGNLLAFTQFQRAEEKYLLANGWVKFGKNHYIAPEIMGVFAGDRLFLNSAVELQKEYDLDLLYRGEMV